MTRRFGFLSTVRAMLLCVWLLSVENVRAQTNPGLEFFERRIRPILVENCYECHSEQAARVQGKLMLDSRAGILRGGESGPAIVPRRPADSLLMAAIRWQSLEMPPKRKLAATIVADFAKWIEDGALMPSTAAAPARADETSPPRQATWQAELSRRSAHWSWQPLQPVKLPTLAAPNHAANPVDHFIAAKLAEHGLVQAPLADRRTLLRRLHFVLLGTPPTPGEVERFTGDSGTDDEAWRRVVERLLAEPSFGERWARHWMDVVRYAETHGSEHDAVIPKSWRYRDYLIRAFNTDLPYDCLVREHLAGDMPPHARWNDGLRINEAALGTAWLRMTEFYHSPVDVKNEEAAVVENIIDTFGKAFQAQTIACARCHDHKFDPISDEDYYALYGIFTSARQGMLIVDRPEMFHRHDETLRSLKLEIRRLLAAQWRSQVAGWPQAIKHALRELTEERLVAGSDQHNSNPWLATLRPQRPLPVEHALYPLVELGRWHGAKDSFPRDWAETQRRMQTALAAEELPSGYVRFADLRGPDLSSWHGRGPGFANRGPAPAGSFALHHQGNEVVAAILPAGVYSHLISSKHGGSLRSPSFTIESAFISALVMGESESRLRLVVENFQGDTILFAPAMPRLKNYTTPRWVRLPIRKQWQGGRAYLELLGRDDDPYIGIMGKDKPGMERASDGRSSCGLLKVVFHDAGSPPRQTPAWDPALCQAATESSDQVITQFTRSVRRAVEAWRSGTASDQQARLLDALLRAGHLPNSIAAEPRLAMLIDRYRRLESEIPVPRRVPGMVDEGAGQHAAFFPRGNHRTPGAPVARRYLQVLGPAGHSFSARAGSGRRALAAEITSPRNPLTARVIVNRLWHWTFGRGIVSTVDNFGTMGQPPTHPELLDYLAIRFVERGWSIKDTVKLLVNSRTFRIRSQASARARELDPENSLLQHAHLRRLDGEAIRDAMLAVSAGLDRQMFGPSVPVWLAESHVSNHKPQNGPLDGRRRRSVYIEVRRNNPYAFFHVFNRPQPTLTTGARAVTTVPAQSLTLLNDPFVIGQAEQWAARLLAEHGQRSVSGLVSRMYEQLFARPASAGELIRAAKFLQNQAAGYGLGVGQLRGDPRPLRDLAHAMFNHKEFIYLQ